MRRIVIPLLFGLIGAAVLVSLGVWQLQRLHWKEGALAQIEARLAEAPVALPASPDPSADKYLAVDLEGRFDPQTVRVLSGVKEIGAGYRLISALETVQGRRVLIDRGFIPVSSETPVPPQAVVRVLGNLLWPDERTASTPVNDLGANIWFARDVADLAATLGTEPLLIVARELDPRDPAVLMAPVDTSHIPNDHLNYAITWFSLAAIWLAMTAYFIRRQRAP